MDYTREEIKKELENFKLPWLARVWKKHGINALKYSIIPAFAIMTIFGIIYNNSSYGQYDWMWIVVKTIAFAYLFGFGLFALAGHQAERIAANKLRRKLGLSHEEFKILVDVYQISGK
jgi:hypothetical protein